MNKKFLLTIKDFFWQKYTYLVVAAVLIYNVYLCYFIYHNYNLIHQNGTDSLSNSVIIDSSAYEKILEQKNTKENPASLETNKNPFNP